MRLVNTKATYIQLRPNVMGDKGVSMSFKHVLNEENKKKFNISFNIKLNTHEDVNLEVNYVGEFESDEELINPHFLEVNAPAIVYPYLRSFVSSTLLQAGYEPLILPAVNFVEHNSP